MTSTEVMIVAAEASSALYAQRLIEYWKQCKPELHCFGIGNLEMEKIGFERIGKSEEMAVVGVAEVIEHYAELKRVFNKLFEEVKRRRPKVVVLMDYPDFNMMLAKKIKTLGIPCVYYIAPQVWAWRKGRVKKIKKYFDQVFVLFPFETEFYTSQGVRAQFVGHPLLDEIDPKYFDEKYRELSRSKRGILPKDRVLGLMPGSRRSEIKLHMKVQMQAAREIYNQYEDIKVLVMVAPTVDVDFLKEEIGDQKFPYILLKEEPFEMIMLTDLILAASGTATLMVGLLHKPMVIMYRLKKLTALLIHLFVHGVKFFGIVNLIMNKEVVPERWQSGADPDKLASLLRRYLDDSEYFKSVLSDLKQLHTQLGEKGATERVAKALEEYFEC